MKKHSFKINLKPISPRFRECSLKISSSERILEKIKGILVSS